MDLAHRPYTLFVKYRRRKYWTKEYWTGGNEIGDELVLVAFGRR